MKTYTPTIGLEIHAELKTKTKMFCGSLNAPHESEPNTHICPVCMGHPGTLPVINQTAVYHVLKVGTALGATHAEYTEFDRKNYFYPDIPKGYQISQYAYPLVSGGSLVDVAITRVHLEEDTARSIHDTGEATVIDYNRAGVPLMELVTEPVIHDATTAVKFARELQLLLRTLGVSDANMERGEMRVEANVSVSTDEVLGNKVEVKNLNSFKSVEQAIEHEIKRQIEILEKNGSVEPQTRGWDEKRLKTTLQRRKETSADYRYFPDPDLPNLTVRELDSRIYENLPEIPREKRLRYANLGIPRDTAEVLVTNLDFGKFFDQVVRKLDSTEDIAKAANFVVSDLLGLTLERTASVESASVDRFVELIRLHSENKLGTRVVKDILFEVAFEDVDPLVLAQEKNLLQISSKSDLIPVVESVIDAHPTVVDQYCAGKDAALQFLVGQGMKQTKGAADPALLAELLMEHLAERRCA